MKKGEDKLIDGYLAGKWITQKQFDKLPHLSSNRPLLCWPRGHF